VQDYYGNQVLASTEDLLSTSGWRELLADFVVGTANATDRDQGNARSGQSALIKGTFWLDDVKLTSIAAPADGPQPF
jgi:hypothetical protein